MMIDSVRPHRNEVSREPREPPFVAHPYWCSSWFRPILKNFLFRNRLFSIAAHAQEMKKRRILKGNRLELTRSDPRMSWSTPHLPGELEIGNGKKTNASSTYLPRESWHRDNRPLRRVSFFFFTPQLLCELSPSSYMRWARPASIGFRSSGATEAFSSTFRQAIRTHTALSSRTISTPFPFFFTPPPSSLLRRVFISFSQNV